MTTSTNNNLNQPSCIHLIVRMMFCSFLILNLVSYVAPATSKLDKVFGIGDRQDRRRRMRRPVAVDASHTCLLFFSDLLKLHITTCIKRMTCDTFSELDVFSMHQDTSRCFENFDQLPLHPNMLRWCLAQKL